MDKTTTNLNVIRDRPSRFSWGKITNIYDIGPRYTIVEFYPRLTKNEQILNFHVYVDGKDTHRSSLTLEGAIILAIAKAQIDNDFDAATRYAAKILDIKNS